jgi:vacuolar-type H+-ATPase subunit I/STV1
MRASFWRLAGGMLAAVVLAGVIGVLVGSAADSQEVGAFTVGVVLLAAWLGFMARARLTITRANGDVFRIHPLFVAGVSLLIVANSLLLADLGSLTLIAFIAGVILIFMGRSRSGVARRP